MDDTSLPPRHIGEKCVDCFPLDRTADMDFYAWRGFRRQAEPPAVNKILYNARPGRFLLSTKARDLYHSGRTSLAKRGLLLRTDPALISIVEQLGTEASVAGVSDVRVATVSGCPEATVLRKFPDGSETVLIDRERWFFVAFERAVSAMETWSSAEDDSGIFMHLIDYMERIKEAQISLPPAARTLEA